MVPSHSPDAEAARMSAARREIAALQQPFRELLTYMMEDPRNITFCIHLMFCAKNIERMGDHATNIAETVYHMVTGSFLSNDRPKADVTSTTPIPHDPK